MVHAKRKLMALRRRVYGLRSYIPWMREQHNLESLVGPLGYWEKLQHYQVSVLMKEGLEPYHTLLDVGCGPLQGGIELIKYLNKNNYTGVDINSKAIKAGLKEIERFNLYKKEPLLMCGNIIEDDIMKGKKYDYIWASQILYYFKSSKMIHLFRKIKYLLSTEGIFLGDVISKNHYVFRTHEHEWYYYSIKELENMIRPFELKIENMGEIVEHGYPKKLSSSTNILIKITKRKQN